MEKAPDADVDGGDGDGDGGAGAGAGEGSQPLTYKTWILRVSIHCGGCKKKVKKVLQNIEGVYKIEIDSKQHRVEVTGNVESGTLIKKLIRSGKNAELWTEKQSKDQGDGAGGDSGEKRIDLTDGPKNGCDSSGEDHAEEKGDGQVAAAQGGGGGGKKKKKKKKKKGNAAGGAPAPAPGGSGWPPPAAATGGPVDQAIENSPCQQVFSYPQFYYPAAEYGMSYNSTAPAPPNASMATSYYTLPMYSYTYESYPTNLSSDSIIDFNHDETGCSIT